MLEFFALHNSVFLTFLQAIFQSIVAFGGLGY
jgi:hypothetical protein